MLTLVEAYGSCAGGGLAGSEDGVPHLAMLLELLGANEPVEGGIDLCSSGCFCGVKTIFCGAVPGFGGNGTFGDGWRGKTGCGRGCVSG